METDSNIKQFLFGCTRSFTPAAWVWYTSQLIYMCDCCSVFFALIFFLFLFANLNNEKKTRVWAQWNIVVTLWKFISIGHQIDFISMFFFLLRLTIMIRFWFLKNKSTTICNLFEFELTMTFFTESYSENYEMSHLSIASVTVFFSSPVRIMLL